MSKMNEFDSIKAAASETPAKNKKAVADSEVKTGQAVKIKALDQKVPHRGFVWYILFILVFLLSSGLTIYFRDWVLLFFIMVFAIVTLWRQNLTAESELVFNDLSVLIGGKEFQYNQIESFYFSSSGDDITITFQMVRKIYPKLTFIINEKAVEPIRKRIGEKVPESEPRPESIIDLIIRKLKI